MPTRSGVIPGVWFALLLVAGAASAEAPNLGKPVGTADVAAWDISIQPNGTGLPPGPAHPRGRGSSRRGYGRNPR
jgi:hypothetical protein